MSERNEKKKMKTPADASLQAKYELASLTSPSPSGTWLKPLIEDIPQFRVIQVNIAVIHTYVSVHAISVVQIRASLRSNFTAANYQDAGTCVLAPDRTGKHIPVTDVPVHVESFHFCA